ncbi:MAG: hypothetical protein OQK78_13185 [Gammaproteobacteria bacterium]|nr:hypothetical protein [Gammaproteobacteria bacterium]
MIRRCTASVELERNDWLGRIFHHPFGAQNMSKGQKSNKEGKKKALLTPKEKKAAKQSKKVGSKGLLS